jgi:hypothetical protein
MRDQLNIFVHIGENRNISKELARSCKGNGETGIPKIILYVLTEGKKWKRKSNEKAERPVPGNVCWSRNRSMRLSLFMVTKNSGFY